MRNAVFRVHLAIWSKEKLPPGSDPQQEPDAVYIIDDDNAPAFLRAAVKFENVTLLFHPKAESKELTEA